MIASFHGEKMSSVGGGSVDVVGAIANSSYLFTISKPSSVVTEANIRMSL
jgi:hypothetical protein